MPILYGGEWGLTSIGWNVPAVIQGKCELSLMGLCVLHYMGRFESNWMCLSCYIVGNCEFACLKFGVPALSDSEFC